MKHLYLISGTMGVGKTTTCQIMKKKLNSSVFLDGDWCWDMDPFIVNDETKKMVINNICFLLNNFIETSVYENIIFCWVMHEQSIIEDILARLNTENCNLHLISLVCDKESLKNRLEKDIDKGVRTEDIINRSLERLKLYENLLTQKVDVSRLTPREVADYIIINC
ncbi:nucleotide kinase [Clostridium sartagoforme]|uniref:Nucleotide kinase n=1 Tax=Clostridium sartagoforme TaxID=84031 RepID=A0A4S2DGM5_9CLOT|nr:AAA family ATPase [Clostridium sartagoforme]TGY41218.1 nucleotide kinase [Clostridium sartagoforme]